MRAPGYLGGHGPVLLRPVGRRRRGAEFAALFGHASLVVQPGAGHFPWLDDPGWFVAAVTGFLSAAVPPETDGHAR
jgi:pimeloyl-ACP methyl ester carboxylesterase